jgi:hypothetical protein
LRRHPSGRGPCAHYRGTLPARLTLLPHKTRSVQGAHGGFALAAVHSVQHVMTWSPAPASRLTLLHKRVDPSTDCSRASSDSSVTRMHSSKTRTLSFGRVTDPRETTHVRNDPCVNCVTDPRETTHVRNDPCVNCDRRRCDREKQNREKPQALRLVSSQVSHPLVQPASKRK